MDPHQIERWDTDTDPHPDPHRRFKLYPHQCADDKPKCMEYEQISALFPGLSLNLEARIRDRIKVTGRIRIPNTVQLVCPILFNPTSSAAHQIHH
jgi:hypothetical protein